MTRGALETPRQATRAAAELARATIPTKTRAYCVVVAVVIAVGLLVLGRSSPARAAIADVEGKIVEKVLIEGNSSIDTEKIRAVIKTRPGRPFENNLADADLKRIHDLKLFADASYAVTKAADGKAVVLTFRVVEMPVLHSVTFIGRKNVRLKDIQESTGLKKGARADSVHARLAVQQVKQIYNDKGFEKAEVKLLKGGNPEDRDVVMEIFEGPKYKVGEINFIGQEFASEAMLRTKLASRKAFLGISLLGHYDKEGYNDDAQTIARYYQDNGFLEVNVKPVVRTGKELGQRDVTFVIDEGKRFKVRNVTLEGNRVYSAAALKAGMKLHSGQFWSESMKTGDYESIKNKYFSQGHIDAQIMVDYKPTPQPDVVDLIYKIEEGPQFRLGELIFKGNHRTKDKVARRHANLAALLPGELLDSKKLDNFKQRLSSTGYFQMNQQKGQPVDVKIVNKRNADRPFGDTVFNADQVSLTRFQNADDPAPPPLTEPPPIDVPPPSNTPPPMVTPGGGSSPASPFGGDGSSRFNPPPDTMPSITAPPIGGSLAPPFGRGNPNKMSGPNGPAGSPYDRTSPSGTAPGFPNGNLNPNITDRQEPFTANQAYADVIASVEEAPTASFVAGAGANSFGGIYGNVTLTENNFNLLAFPRSWNDFTQQKAFRGAGQQLSLSLNPGTLINYYQIRFFDPAIFDLPIGFGLQAYQFRRSYMSWTEFRSGGKMTFAYRWTQSFAELGVRAEDVDINGFKYPAPAALLAVSGHTQLYSLRPSFAMDTRDNPFLATSGRYVELAYEQGFGTFNFGKITAEGRKYFTLFTRPDGSGKQVLTVRGFFGVASLDTPIYERFFAGNLNSLRGFQYRGIGPYDLGVNTGGFLTALSSVEYRFPWNAKDTFYQVVFCDTGTVENSYSITNYRVSVGTGIRFIIPQIFKQAPLAFDLAFPVSKGPQDKVQAFNFSIGGSW